MTKETRTCQNCKQIFTVEPEDFDFYKKISVPPPTFCSECRLQRRMAFFNLIHLWKRKCDLCGKESMSAYPPDAPYKVYCPPCWWSDAWDPFEYGQDYDFSRPFFEQFNELLHKVPHLGLLIESNVFETSPYNNYAGSLKNCRLLFHAEFDEQCENGYYVFHGRDLFDTSLTDQCEQCFDSMHIYKVHKGVGLRNQASESLDCFFLRDCMNCQNCFASANLRNKKYYILNKPYTKEDYFAELKKWDLGSYKTYQEVKHMSEMHWDLLPHKMPNADFNVNCTGNIVFRSKNCKDCFELIDGQDCRYVHMCFAARDSYDVTGWSGIERCYESFCVGRGAVDVRFSFLAALPASNMEYSALAVEGNGFFGCVSVKKGEYCILNKRYSKEEFTELRKKIIEHMNAQPYTDRAGRIYRYGEFFPVEMSPWAYNDTLAQNLFPLDDKRAAEQGYRWNERSRNTYTITRKTDELPDHIKDAGDDVLREVFQCSTCERGFKLTSSELSFLRNTNLPLPRRCPFCRIEEKLGIWCSELKLTEGACAKCKKAMKISLAFKDKPLVFCRECYLAEVV